MSMNGAQLAPLCAAADVNALLNAKARLLRYPICWAGPIQILNYWSNEQWREFVRSHLDHIDTLLPHLHAVRAKLVIDLHHPCGGFDPDAQAAMFASRPELQAEVCDCWREIATRYAGSYDVIAYDLLNEPAANDGKKVTEFYRAVLPVVRACAPYKRVVLSSPYGFAARMNELVAVDGPTWYTAHLYDPLAFTHQGINGLPPKKLTESMRQSLSQAVGWVRSWQRKNPGSIIYIGEFSASTTASESDRDRYFHDVINYTEKYAWHWTAHAWRESPYWNLETPKVGPRLRAAWK